jgi:hypothetical protein
MVFRSWHVHTQILGIDLWIALSGSQDLLVRSADALPARDLGIGVSALPPTRTCGDDHSLNGA